MKSVSPNLEANMKSSGAWNHPDARAAIEAALPKIREAEEADNRAEVDELIKTLNNELTRILGTLSSTPTPLPEDAQRWCETLLDDSEHGYDMAKDTVNIVLDSAKGEVCPNKEQVKAALLKTLTREQITELKKLREPTLLIIPDTTAARLQAAVNKPACKTMLKQNDAYFDTDNFYTNALSAIAAQQGVPADQPKITKYRFVITEGKQYFDATDGDHDAGWNKREEMESEDRIAAFEAYLQSCPGLVSQNAAMFMMLMIRGLKQGKPTDRINDKQWQFTLLPGEPKAEHVKNGLVADGDWREDLRRANFSDAVLERGGVAGRLRAAVMGEIHV